MEDKKPLLSICIPTYNRADILDKSIASIVTQQEFESDEVELVVSDNASNDNTEEIVKKYQKKYKNIFYFKNSENIRDKNYPIVIERAHGIFRKLCNDTLIFKTSAVSKLVESVKNNVAERPVLFFLNALIKKLKKEFYTVSDFDTFVKTISFYSTWIGGFGIWEDDYTDIMDKFSGCELSLWQTNTLFEKCSKKGKYLIDNSKLFDATNLERKNLNYGLYKVFYENYLGLCRKQLLSHNVSATTFYFLQKDLLFGFFLPWIINLRYNYKQYILSGDEDLYQLILNTYRQKKYFVFFLLKLKTVSMKRYVRKIIRGA